MLGLRATVVAVAATVLGVAGCTVEDGSPPSTGSEAAGSPSPATTAAPSPRSPSGATTGADLPEPPRDGACYRLDFEAATEPTNDSSPVPCEGPHTAQTYHVGRLDTVVDGHLLAVDSRRAQRQVARTCPRVLARHLGGSAETRALSRLEAIWFSPTIEESDRGASWFRCDVVAVAGSGELAPLPPPRRLRGLLDDPAALDRVGLCGTAAPDARGFERVICSRRHAWRATSTIPIADEGAYPGVEAVREAGESTCRNRVREASGSPERFSYGWEWPTRAQWRAGQRFGYCWAPD